MFKFILKFKQTELLYLLTKNLSFIKFKLY